MTRTSLNTLKTVIGFAATLITRYTPLNLAKSSLEGIFNYLRINKHLITSGQPTEQQLELVKLAGIQRVINLAPHNVENALVNEKATVESLDLHYTNIPVDFQNPTDEDFKQFCFVMKEAGDSPLLLHCAANMRVSAFLYRYRCEVLNERPETAIKDMHKIWQPFGVWKQFVAKKI